MTGLPHRDFEGKQLRRYPEHFDNINIIFIVVEERYLYKVELNPDRLKQSAKIMISKCTKNQSDRLIDYHVIDKQYCLVLNNRSLGLVNMTT